MSPCSTTFIMPEPSLNPGVSITTRSGHTAAWGISPLMNIGNNWSRLRSPDMINFPKRLVDQNRGQGHRGYGSGVGSWLIWHMSGVSCREISPSRSCARLIRSLARPAINAPLEKVFTVLSNRSSHLPASPSLLHSDRLFTQYLYFLKVIYPIAQQFRTNAGHDCHTLVITAPVNQ